MIMYIWPHSGENLLKLRFGLIQLIGLTRPKFDVWPNDVWSRPKIANTRPPEESSGEQRTFIFGSVYGGLAPFSYVKYLQE